MVRWSYAAMLCVLMVSCASGSGGEATEHDAQPDSGGGEDSRADADDLDIHADEPGEQADTGSSARDAATGPSADTCCEDSGADDVPTDLPVEPADAVTDAEAPEDAPSEADTGPEDVGVTDTGPEEVSDSLHGSPVPEALSAVVIDIPGYARGTIGGRDGTVYVVTTLADEGEGSLREALESEQAHWIVFEQGLNGSIRLERQIDVKSFKTVDARGHRIVLEGVRDENEEDAAEGWYDTGLTLGNPDDQISEVHDVILLNLEFNGNWPDPDEDGEGADGLHLHNNVHRVWVHRCTFHHWIDGAIDARADEGFETLPRDISITESHFYDINQGLLLEAARVTFARNYCDNLNTRCVKTLDGGSAHVVNNVIRRWRGIEIVYAEGASQILADHNIFRPGRDSRTAGRTSDGGSLQDLHNIEHRGSAYQMNGRNSVTPEFKREAQAAYGLERRVDCDHDPVDRECWDALYDDLVNNAGVSDRE